MTTLNTILFTDNPRGTQLITNNTKVCQMYIIPRDDIYQNKILNIDKIKRDLEQCCVLYFLLTEGDHDKAYIGQTSSFMTRIKNHKSKKWDKALVILRGTTPFRKEEIEYLEHLAISEAVQLESADGNKVTPKKPQVDFAYEEGLKSLYEEVRFLVTFADSLLFTKTTIEPTAPEYICKGSGALARGNFGENNTFIVYKGSVIRESTSPQYRDKDVRNLWLKKHVKKEGGQLILQENYLFTSPSTASSYVLGRSSNGWNDWKTEDGKKLADVCDK